jgi:hypothetical protein
VSSVVASWSTTCFGTGVDAASLELSALGEHLSLCRRLRGPLFALRCSAEAMNGFASARFVTTLIVLLLLGSLGSLAF